MCCNPVIIYNKSRYKNKYLSPVQFSVPCGNCVECRSSKQSDWRVRLAHEINYTYNNRGSVLMLLLTYNAQNLPWISYPSSMKKHGVLTPCFSRDDITYLLNNVRTYIYDHYDKASFRFYLASEYGDTTKRPHYHILFFLPACLDPDDFYEVVENFWCSKGYLFPKRKSHGVYVKWNKVKKCYDNAFIQLRNLAASSNYVSKYVTKDLSYFGLPSVNDYLINVSPKLRSNPSTIELDRKYRRSLPFTRCSKGLGYCMVYDKSFNNLVDMVLNGVQNPLTLKLEKLPSSILRRLLFRNVKTDDISLITGKPKYEPILSPLGKLLLPYSFRARYSTYADSYRKLMNLSFTDFNNICKLAKVDSNEVRSLVFDCRSYLSGCVDGNISLDSALSTLKVATSSLSDYVWHFLRTYALENKIYDIEFVQPFWLLSKRLKFANIKLGKVDDVVCHDWLTRHRENSTFFLSEYSTYFYEQMLKLLFSFDSMRTVLNRLIAEEKERQYDLIKKTKSLFY